jgi:hypothetical protein
LDGCAVYITSFSDAGLWFAPNTVGNSLVWRSAGLLIKAQANSGQLRPTLEHQMSCLAEFRKLEQQLASQLAELETMKGDAARKKRSSLRPTACFAGSVRLQLERRIRSA